MYRSRYSGTKKPFVNERGSTRHEKGWNGESKQYNDLVGDKGHYYHQHVVIPKSLDLLHLSKDSSVLDLGCGQGVLARVLPKTTSYVGVDNAKGLIDFAKRLDSNPHHRFEVLSATRPLSGIRKDFTHATCILALQNMEYPDHLVKNASTHLIPGGKLLIVLNHPAFRIPRQSGWSDQLIGIQQRWINRYMSYLKIPINMHPSHKKESVTMSYHLPISRYSQMLKNHGFLIEAIEEWTSDKESAGVKAKSENRARSEFPLFMAILAVKKA
mgnify:CR=1 FL=1